MKKLADMPYVTDREAYVMARVLQVQGYPDIARRIRRAVWARRLVAVASLTLIGAGLGLVFVGVLSFVRGG